MLARLIGLCAQQRGGHLLGMARGQTCWLLVQHCSAGGLHKLPGKAYCICAREGEQLARIPLQDAAPDNVGQWPLDTSCMVRQHIWAAGRDLDLPTQVCKDKDLALLQSYGRTWSSTFHLFRFQCPSYKVSPLLVCVCVYVRTRVRVPVYASRYGGQRSVLGIVP